MHATKVYAISPEGHDAFVLDLEQRRNLGATQTLTPSFEPSGCFCIPSGTTRLCAGYCWWHSC